MKLFIYSAFLLLLAPCNASKKTAGSAQEGKADKDREFVVIGYEKTVCFGKCPAFKMTITGAGLKAVYVGDSNVDKLGTYEKKISADEFQKLCDLFEKNKFFEMKDEYTSQITDVPSKYISYSSGGNSKKVKDRYNAPAELKEIEKLLDAIADSEGWIKTADKPSDDK